MPLSHYGVLKAPLADRLLATGQSGHYHLLCGAGSQRSRVAVNARSAVAPSEVAYAIVSPFANPLADRLSALADGWTELASGGGLDFIRGNLAQPAHFRPLPLSAPGAANDLNDLLDFHLRPLIGQASARVYALGSTWGPEPKADEYFHFTPGRGVHDIHQNQGNVGRFADDDGVWQDGGLLIHANGVWTAILMRFQSQGWHTDDRTGHTISGTPAPAPAPAADGAVRIVAAAVNPPGAGTEAESVVLLNTTYAPVNLQGWRLVTGTGRANLDGTVPAAAARSIALPQTAPLSNDGGTITLLDAAGLKVHGVAYSAQQAASEARLLVF
jgi:uncharacterized protein YukJ